MGCALAATLLPAKLLLLRALQRHSHALDEQSGTMGKGLILAIAATLLTIVEWRHRRVDYRPSIFVAEHTQCYGHRYLSGAKRQVLEPHMRRGELVVSDHEYS